MRCQSVFSRFAATRFSRMAGEGVAVIVKRRTEIPPSPLQVKNWLHISEVRQNANLNWPFLDGAGFVFREALLPQVVLASFLHPTKKATQFNRELSTKVLFNTTRVLRCRGPLDSPHHLLIMESLQRLKLTGVCN